MQKNFLEKAEEKAFDKKHRETIRHNIAQYDKKVPEAKAQFNNLEKARQLAHKTKWYAIEKLAKHLELFEQHFTRNGGKVIWAETAEQAAEAVLRIAKEHEVSKVVKSKSMVTEEIHLNKHLEKAGISVLETDLGEYIVQLEDSTPYHIVTPIMHKSRQDVAKLFNEKFDLPESSTPEQIARYVREKLREQFVQAEMGITGANFLIADTGGIALTENEGNARMTTTFPKVHVAIAGIEKILPSYQHLDLFWPLLASYGTGQWLTVYNTILHGPKAAGEKDGPEHMYVILLDNGRTNIIANPRQRESLYCIRCGACLNACPVYKTIGGHTYDTTYQGPIGKVISPNLYGKKEYAHLSNASSLCGNCTANCPVHINLHELILDNRHEEMKDGLKPRAETFSWSIWQKVMLSRQMMNLPSGFKNFGIRYFFKSAWGERREMPKVAPKSFNKMWRDGELG